MPRPKTIQLQIASIARDATVPDSDDEDYDMVEDQDITGVFGGGKPMKIHKNTHHSMQMYAESDEEPDLIMSDAAYPGAKKPCQLCQLYTHNILNSGGDIVKELFTNITVFLTGFEKGIGMRQAHEYYTSLVKVSEMQHESDPSKPVLDNIDYATFYECLDSHIELPNRCTESGRGRTSGKRPGTKTMSLPG